MLITIMSGFGILMVINQVFQLEIAGFLPITNAYYYYFLAFFLSMVFLLFPGSSRNNRNIDWYDWCLFVISITATLYLGTNAMAILNNGWEFEAPLLPTIAAYVIWGLSLEAVRRTGGGIIFSVCLLFSLYPLFSDQLPGILYGTSFTLTEIATISSLGTESIIGIPTRVVADLFAGFLILGVALVSSGGGQWFMDFALSLLGRARGGGAKVAVVSSAFMASISGSVVSNVVTTGSMTIPAMKKTGYSARWAAAIEACASTGGVITPPIMGAAAFIMASFTNVSYGKIMTIAMFPAMLYFLVLILQVDLHAAKTAIGGMRKEDIPGKLKTLKDGWYFIFSIILLIVMLGVFRLDSWAPFYVIAFLLIIAWVRKKDRFTWSRFVDFIFESGKLLTQIAGILAGIGLIIGSLSVTGTADSFSRELILLANGNTALLLIIGALTSFFLGMGMTVSACYIFLAIVLVPALVENGLNELGCHLFILYYGTLSFITPPVALGSITAATIAKSNNTETAVLSMRLGILLFVLPFIFVLNPLLLLEGPIASVLSTCVIAIIGCILLACSLEGYLYFVGTLTFAVRVAIGLASLLLLYPAWISNLAGAGLFSLCCGFIFFRRKRIPAGNTRV